jgi:MFS transporter, Spinster family, sphingosine-1-phosphate transporter
MEPNTYKRYLLALLLVLLAFNFMDRVALGLVLQDIKADLHLTDTQLGVLSGIAFALFYSVMGIPIARWADRGNRVTIISLTAASWSVAVAFCGMAGSFVQLLLARVGVAVGEAGGYVPAYSLLADYFDRAERPRALAIYGLGGPLSVIGGYSLAGWLNELYGWRVMFALLGAPGLVLAVVARFTLREPRRDRSFSTFSAHSEPQSILEDTDRPAKWEGQLPHPSLKVVCRSLWANATFRHLLLCLSVLFFFIYGIVQWQPTFFIRSFRFTSGQLGAWFAAIYGIGGALGAYLGGELSSRYAAQNERVQLLAIAIVMIGCAALSAGVYLSSNPYLALGLMAGVGITQSAVNAPLYATMQTLVPDRMRAMSVALVLFFANLIGMGLGPLATGALSDAMRSWAGEESLRYALLILAPGFLWPAWHAWRASRTVTGDLAAKSVDNEGTTTNVVGAKPGVMTLKSVAHDLLP